MSRPSSFDYDQLLACARGEMFGPGNAKLPAPPMLMFDRITEISTEGGKYGKGVIRAELDIRPDLWFFQCHFEGDPVMPGCLGVDAMWQLCGFYLPWLGEPGRGRALGVGQVKFTGQVLPDAKLVRYELDIRRVMRGKLALVIADGRMLVDGQMVQREDDKPETVRHRLEVYREQTAPLSGFYEEEGLLSRIDAIGEVEEVTARALEALGADAAPDDPKPDDGAEQRDAG